MGIFRSLSGSLLVELTSADVSGMLRTVNKAGITVRDVRPDGDLTVCFTVAQRDLRSIERLTARKGARIKVISRKGIFWPILGLKRRPILLMGLTVLLSLSLFLPSRVLFVEVEGNGRVPGHLIMEAAQEAGIRFGASRRAVRSEKMKNELLGTLPQLQWAGVNTYGCTAVISVRERADETRHQADAAVSRIIASTDGVITSCTVTGGSGLCSVGQAVQKGQVLISGYTDCGGVTISGRAKGEVFAETLHELTVVMPSSSQNRTRYNSHKTNFSLLIGKKRINFYKGSGISDSRCVKMSTQYHLTLPGGYVLPLTLIKETIAYCDTQEKPVEKEPAQTLLSELSQQYLQHNLVALAILDTDELMQSTGDCWRLDGVYACTEMIGREQGEQIGDFHGKTD